MKTQIAPILASFMTNFGTGLTYDTIKSVACGVDIEDVNDVTYDYVDGAITGLLGSMGVKDRNLEDLVGGIDAYSNATMDAIAKSLEDISEEDLFDKIDNFAQTYSYEDEPTFDSVSPPRCKSGYKRKLVMKNGKPTWKCMRLFGKVHLSAKQKMALRKAQHKAHSARANIHRDRSNKARKSRNW